jgi:hypothetical protein
MLHRTKLKGLKKCTRVSCPIFAYPLDRIDHLLHFNAFEVLPAPFAPVYQWFLAACSSATD